MVRSIIAFGLLISAASSGFAVDLSQIDRSPPKLPTLQSAKPEYCLLVFGADAHKRVWLVRDGNVLYVDRNGNGDLTDPDDRVEVNREESNLDDGILYFHAGNIPDGERLHKDLRVSWYKVDHLADEDDRVKALMAKNPKWRGCTTNLDIDMPGQHGGGIDGRVTERTSVQDENGYLEFTTDPSSAPIIHYDAPWQITFYNQTPTWHLGGLERLNLAVGSPGIGPGTTAFVDYQGVITPESHPKVKVSYPPTANGKSPQEATYDLTQRCCGINLYGAVNVPDNVGLGTAQVEVSLDNSPGLPVTPSTHTAEIAQGKPGFKLEPISARLKSSLSHSNQPKHEKDDPIVQIQFSPDGKRLIAGDYPGGAVNVWDLENGKRLAVVEMDRGFRAGFDYFAVSPDWKTIYSPTRERGYKYEKIERDGVAQAKWSFDDSVRVFDLNSGTPLHEWQHSPPREIRTLDLSPDGSHFFTAEGVPGEYSSTYPRVMSIWDAATGEHRELPAGINWLALFSPDGKQFAAAIDSGSAALPRYETIKIFDTDSLSERTTIPLPKETNSAWPCAFSGDGRVLAARIGGGRDEVTTLKCYDVKTGKELLFCSSPRGEGFYPVKTSPDGHTLAAASARSKGGSVSIVNLNDFSVRTVHLEDERDTIVSDIAFDSSGKMLAVSTVCVPQGLQLGDDPSADKFPQPRIHLVDVSTGKILETMTAPQCTLNSLAFSPDGKLLATSGAGEVLLWDLDEIPGRPATNE